MQVALIDDDESLHFLIKEYLRLVDSNIEIISFHYGEELLALERVCDCTAYIVDYDFGASRMNGLEIIHHLRESEVNVPIIMLSGRSRREIEKEALSLGADYYLEKNASFIQLTAEIDHQIRKITNNYENARSLIIGGD